MKVIELVNIATRYVPSLAGGALNVPKVMTLEAALENNNESMKDLGELENFKNGVKKFWKWWQSFFVLSGLLISNSCLLKFKEESIVTSDEVHCLVWIYAFNTKQSESLVSKFVKRREAEKDSVAWFKPVIDSAWHEGCLSSETSVPFHPEHKLSNTQMHIHAITMSLERHSKFFESTHVHLLSMLKGSLNVIS